MITEIQLLGISAIFIITIGMAFIVTSHLQTTNTKLHRAIHTYLANLENDLRFIRSKHSGRRLALAQILFAGIVIILVYISSPLLLLLLPLIAVAPTLHLKSKCDRRILRIEQQLDSWLLAMANTLKAVPSIGDALSSSQSLMHAPISEELDMVIKEHQLGTSLDRALQHMVKRIKSRVIGAALITLQIAQRTGGDLPATLESSAASLREMARLEGVFRTKTADGRNQAFVVGSLPAILIISIYFLHPDLLTPLFNTTTGNILLGIALALWIGAIIVSLNILQVDI